ncbi:MAG: DUF952 domain-containing protein [Caldilineaceae bacterium]
MIYHMLPQAVWRRQPLDELYEGDTLHSEGFIHCTGERQLLVRVANNFYRDDADAYVILAIDEDVVLADVKWDTVGFLQFPHIYGPLNLDAVVEVIGFPRLPDGQFVMPPEWESEDSIQ